MDPAGLVYTSQVHISAWKHTHMNLYSVMDRQGLPKSHCQVATLIALCVCVTVCVCVVGCQHEWN